MSTPKHSDDDLKRAAGIKDELFDNLLRAVLGGVDAIFDRRLTPIEQHLEKLDDVMQIIKATLKTTNKDLQNHEVRITRLETAS